MGHVNWYRTVFLWYIAFELIVRSATALMAEAVSSPFLNIRAFRHYCDEHPPPFPLCGFLWYLTEQTIGMTLAAGL